MNAVYLGAGFVIILASAVGLVIVRPRSMADRMLAVQLIGSSVVAVSLLLLVVSSIAMSFVRMCVVCVHVYVSVRVRVC